MTVKDLIAYLKQMPQDAEVIYSVDEEGNSFHPVYIEPTVGKFDPEDNEFLPEPDKDSENYSEQEAEYKNYPGKSAVCIN